MRLRSVPLGLNSWPMLVVSALALSLLQTKAANATSLNHDQPRRQTPSLRVTTAGRTCSKASDTSPGKPSRWRVDASAQCVDRLCAKGRHHHASGVLAGPASSQRTQHGSVRQRRVVLTQAFSRARPSEADCSRRRSAVHSQALAASHEAA